VSAAAAHCARWDVGRSQAWATRCVRCRLQALLPTTPCRLVARQLAAEVSPPPTAAHTALLGGWVQAAAGGQGTATPHILLSSPPHRRLLEAGQRLLPFPSLPTLLQRLCLCRLQRQVGQGSQYLLLSKATQSAAMCDAWKACLPKYWLRSLQGLVDGHLRLACAAAGSCWCCCRCCCCCTARCLRWLNNV
jgi:hypothetical protein